MHLIIFEQYGCATVPGQVGGPGPEWRWSWAPPSFSPRITEYQKIAVSLLLYTRLWAPKVLRRLVLATPHGFRFSNCPRCSAFLLIGDGVRTAAVPSPKV